jgi:hypothetical protein
MGTFSEVSCQSARKPAKTAMKPHTKSPDTQRELFRASLDEILDKKHELVTLANKMNW